MGWDAVSIFGDTCSSMAGIVAEHYKYIDGSINQYVKVAANKQGYSDEAGQYMVAAAQIGLVALVGVTTGVVAIPAALPFLYAGIAKTICKLVTSYYFMAAWKLDKQVGLNRLIGDELKSSGEFSKIQKLCWGCQKFLWSLLDTVYKSVNDAFNTWLGTNNKGDETEMTEAQRQEEMAKVEGQITEVGPEQRATMHADEDMPENVEIVDDSNIEEVVQYIMDQGSKVKDMLPDGTGDCMIHGFCTF